MIRKRCCGLLALVVGMTFGQSMPAFALEPEVQAAADVVSSAIAKLAGPFARGWETEAQKGIAFTASLTFSPLGPQPHDSKCIERLYGPGQRSVDLRAPVFPASETGANTLNGCGYS